MIQRRCTHTPGINPIIVHTRDRHPLRSVPVARRESQRGRTRHTSHRFVCRSHRHLNITQRSSIQHHRVTRLTRRFTHLNGRINHRHTGIIIVGNRHHRREGCRPRRIGRQAGIINRDTETLARLRRIVLRGRHINSD